MSGWLTAAGRNDRRSKETLLYTTCDGQTVGTSYQHLTGLTGRACKCTLAVHFTCLVAHSTSCGADRTCVHVCKLNQRETSAGKLMLVAVRSLWLLCCVAGSVWPSALSMIERWCSCFMQDLTSFNAKLGGATVNINLFSDFFSKENTGQVIHRADT